MEEPVIEQTERTIPFAAVAPLIAWARNMIERSQLVDPMLVSTHDDAATAAGLQTSAELFRLRKERLVEQCHKSR